MRANRLDKSAVSTRGIEHLGSEAAIVRAYQQEQLVAEGLIAGRFITNKFGSNPDVSTGTAPEDVWSGGGLYTGFPTGSPETFEILSSDPNDTILGSGARTVRLFYLDDNYDGFNSADTEKLSVDLEMNGVTPVVTTGITGMRCNTVRVLTAGVSGTNEGILTVRHSITTANIFAVITAGDATTNQVVYTIPAGYTGYIMSYSAYILGVAGPSAELSLAIRGLDGPTVKFNVFTVDAASSVVGFTPYGGVRVVEKSDIALRIDAVSNNNVLITGQMDIRLVLNPTHVHIP
jgi:hypothetical protein